MENIYKHGDIVVHIKPEYDRYNEGSGWHEGAIWRVNKERINGGCSENCVWTDSDIEPSGVYPRALRYATHAEIMWFNQGNTSIKNMPKTPTYELY